MQAIGVEMLLVSEERLKAQDFVDRFRLALVAHDPATWVKRLYPDWTRAPEPESTAEGESAQEVTEDDLEHMEDKTFIFPEELTPEEADRMWQEVMARPGGTMKMSDLEDEGWQ